MRRDSIKGRGQSGSKKWPIGTNGSAPPRTALGNKRREECDWAMKKEGHGKRKILRRLFWDGTFVDVI
jgi:hypothetical protein